MKFPKIPYWPLLIGPWLSFGVGFTLNALVMAANKGQMPVILPGGDASILDPSDLIHCAMTSTTHLKFLADWIVINGLGIASPGDFFEWAYEFTWFPALIAWITLVLKDYSESRY